MEIQRGYYRYWTVRFDDYVDGCGGLRIYQEARGETKVVATVTYWDACPGFWIETLGQDIPVEVALAAIQEAEAQLKEAAEQARSNEPRPQGSGQS